jgi:hypothetical protein
MANLKSTCCFKVGGKVNGCSNYYSGQSDVTSVEIVIVVQLNKCNERKHIELPDPIWNNKKESS